MSKKSLLVVLLIGVLAALVVAPAAAQDKVTITWFVGLGTGTNEQQIAAENQVVEDFNKSQDKIELVVNIASANEAADDLFTTLLAGALLPILLARWASVVPTVTLINGQTCNLWLTRPSTT